MANENLISTTELIRKATEIIKNHQLVLDEAADSYKNLVNSAKLPSNYVSNLKSQKASLDAINKSTQQLEKTEKQLQRERLAELKLQKRREQAFDKFDKQQQRLIKNAEREQKQIERTQGLYNRVQRGISNLTRQYNDLAIRKELNGKLSDKEALQLGQLEGKLNKYQRALKNVDSRIGKHNRNVGNYASTFDGLGFSVAQITRELPAFAVSMQTGFLAISNNIPMLTDEITRLKIANKELAASGKPTVSVMKQLGKSIFGVQSLISIGVTLLTVYGAKLLDWAFGQTEAEKATEEATKKLEEQNKAIEENIRLRNQQLGDTTNFINNIGIVEELRKVLNDVIGDTERADAVLLELSERFSKLGIGDSKILKDENILQSDRVRIAFNLLEIEKQQNYLSQERLSVDRAVKKENEVLQKLAKGEITQLEANKELQDIKNVSLVKTIEIQKRINQLQKNNQSIIGKTIQIHSKKDDSDVNKNIKEQTENLKNSEKAFESQIATLEELKSKTEVGSTAWKIYNNLIKVLQATLKGLKGELSSTEKGLGEVSTEFPDLQDKMEEAIKTIEALRRETEKFIESFSKDFVKNSPFSSLGLFMDGTFSKLLKHANTAPEKFAVSFNAIAEVAQDTFSFINELGQASFEAQYQRLEAQKNTALLFAGENTEGREEIEAQYEERRATIQRRQAEAQKKQAEFNVVVDTAQAIVSTFARVGFPAGVPLAAVMAGIGAAQLLAIKSQEIPAFWMGGETGSNGSIMVNDDPFGIKGRNYREVIEKPGGKILRPQGKNVKMNVPKGTKIHPTYSSFLESMNSRLMSNGISPFSDKAMQTPLTPITIKESSGLSEEIFKQAIGGLENTIKNQTGIVINMDESGFRKNIVNGSAKTKILNRKIHKKARRF